MAPWRPALEDTMWSHDAIAPQPSKVRKLVGIYKLVKATKKRRFVARRWVTLNKQLLKEMFGDFQPFCHAKPWNYPIETSMNGYFNWMIPNLDMERTCCLIPWPSIKTHVFWMPRWIYLMRTCVFSVTKGSQMPQALPSQYLRWKTHVWYISLYKPNPMDPLGQVSTRSQPQNSKSRAKAAMGSTIVVLPWDMFGPRKTHDMAVATFHGCAFREAR